MGQGPSVGAVIVAAGQGLRMGGTDKILAPLLGRPLISHSLDVFGRSPAVGGIVLVVSEDNVGRCRRLVEELGLLNVIDVCAGGQRRQDSVRGGLARLPDAEWVVVHDGARPCVEPELIERGLAAARATGAAVAAVPANDTLKLAGPDLVVTETLPRDRIWAVQTPQVFREDILAIAHRSVSEDVTDDATMVERTGGKVKIFTGAHDNIKVTTPHDVAIAEAILSSRAASMHSPGR